MAENQNNLIWIDLEMTGLDPERDRIIEIATLVTDANLNILAEGPVLAVHQSA
ncbi:oligoribonuclease, partial [Yersinia pestis]